MTWDGRNDARIANGLSFSAQSFGVAGFMRVIASPALDANFPASNWPSTPSGTLQAPVTGWYSVYGEVAFTTGPTSVAHRRGVGIDVAATTSAAYSSTEVFTDPTVANNGSTWLSVSGLHYVQAGEFIRLGVYTDSLSGTTGINPGRLRAVLL